MKQLQGYKTIMVAAIAFIVAVAGALGPLDPNASYGVIGMAILMAVMRVVTTTPIGGGKPQPVAEQSAASLATQLSTYLAERRSIDRLLTDIVKAVTPTGPVGSPPIWAQIPPGTTVSGTVGGNLPPAAGAPAVPAPVPPTQPPAQAAPPSAEPPVAPV